MLNIPAVVAALPKVVAVVNNPTVMLAAKAGLKGVAIGVAINAGMRYAARAGNDYLVRKETERQIDYLREHVAANPRITTVDLNAISEHIPSVRRRSFAEQAAFAWEVTWTSVLTGVAGIYMILTSPVWAIGILLKKALDAGTRLLNISRRRAGKADRESWGAAVYRPFRKVTVGVVEWIQRPYTEGITSDLSEVIVWSANAKKPEELRKNITVTTFDSKDLKKDAPLVPVSSYDKVAMNRLRATYAKVCATQRWTFDDVAANPSLVARYMRSEIRQSHRKQLRVCRQTLPAFGRELGLDEEQIALLDLGWATSHLTPLDAS